MKFIVFIVTLLLPLFGLEIIQKPIDFSAKRIALTKKYLDKHYNLKVNTIEMEPKIIVLHYTALNNFNKSFNRFIAPTLPSDRPEIAKAGELNVATHFLVNRDGSIYQLMPDNFVARHVIGLNYSAIGIENVGGEAGVLNLTSAQKKANVALVEYLISKYESLTYLIGHSEYRCFEEHPLWLETDTSYRTKKSDPGKRFLSYVRKRIPELMPAPCESK